MTRASTGQNYETHGHPEKLAFPGKLKPCSMGVGAGIMGTGSPSGPGGGTAWLLQL